MDPDSLRQDPDGGGGQHPGLQGGLELRRDRRPVPVHYEVKPAALDPGLYTNISGNTALAWGLVAASQLAQLPLFLGSYPITPASDILHELSKHKNFGVRTMQAEDEIAGVGAALGAAYAGSLGVTTTSGPGIDLKQETIGLAVSLELPLLIIDIQRGGPSTGLPTKTEQGDLLQAMFGRHGETPVPIVAPPPPATASRCHRGGPDRRQLPHAGLPALRRVPGQRGRAVAGPRHGVASRHQRAVRHRDQPRQRRRRTRFLALYPGPRDPGPALGHPWHPGPHPSHRRPGKGRRLRRCSYDPANHDR